MTTAEMVQRAHSGTRNAGPDKNHMAHTFTFSPEQKIQAAKAATAMYKKVFKS